MNRTLRLALAEYVAIKCGLERTEKELAHIVKHISDGSLLYRRHYGSAASKRRVVAAVTALKEHQ